MSFFMVLAIAMGKKNENAQGVPQKGLLIPR